MASSAHIHYYFLLRVEECHGKQKRKNLKSNRGSMTLLVIVFVYCLKRGLFATINFLSAKQLMV